MITLENFQGRLLCRTTTTIKLTTAKYFLGFLGRRRRPYIVFTFRYSYGFMFVYIYIFLSLQMAALKSFFTKL